jgi:hypothetical protein
MRLSEALHASVIAGVAVVCLLCSCTAFLTGSLPPGIERDGSELHAKVLAAASPEARFAMLSWYQEQAGGRRISAALAELIQKEQNAAALELYRKWAQQLAKDGYPLVEFTADGVLKFNPALLGKRENWDENSELLRNVRQAIDEPIRITIPLEECDDDAYWKHSTPNAWAAFEAYASRKKTLVVPDPPQLTRLDLLRELDQIKSLVDLRHLVMDSLAEAARLKASDAGLKALELLEETRKGLPAGISFDTIGDKRTLNALESAYAELPESIAKRQLDSFAKALDDESRRLEESHKVFDAHALSVLGSVEGDFSIFLHSHGADKRFAAAWIQLKDQLEAVVSQCAAMRIICWRKQFKDLVDHQEYWDAAEFYRSCILLLQDTSKQELDLYRDTIAENSGVERISNALYDDYSAMLPRVYDEYMKLADEAANITNRHGLVVALCVMLQKMTELAGDKPLPPKVIEWRPKTEALFMKSSQMLEETYLIRTISIGDMSSTTPGIGLTYSRDLENEMRDFLNRFGLAKQVRIVENGGSLSPFGYVVYGGVVANFDGQESATRQAMRTLRRKGQVKRRPNPDYQPEAQPPQPKKFLSPILFYQDILEQVIHVTELERLAHIRVFFNLRAPGTTALIEVNEFYSKKFIQEESHPLTDIRITESQIGYDASELDSTPDVEPVLVYDRVWTPGEMLDWARKDSLRLAALKLLYEVNQYPQYLAQKAERHSLAGEIADAVEQWGACYTLCASLNLETDLVTTLKADPPPATSSYDSCVENLRQQRQSCQELKKSVPARMIAQVNELLRRQRAAATQPTKN